MNSSLVDRRQSFFLKINDLQIISPEIISPEKFDKLLDEACSVGVLVKLQEDKKNHRTPAQIYADFLKRFGKKAFVIRNFSEPAYYKLRNCFLWNHDIGKDIFFSLKKLRERIQRKEEKRLAREKYLKEMQEAYEKIWHKYNNGLLEENDILEIIDFLKKRGVIEETVGDDYDFFWKTWIPQANGRATPEIKKYKYVGVGPDGHSFERIFFNDLKYIFAKAILAKRRQRYEERQRQAIQSQIQSQKNETPRSNAYHGSSEGGGSRKVWKAISHEFRGGKNQENKKSWKKSRAQKRLQKELHRKYPSLVSDPDDD